MLEPGGAEVFEDRGYLARTLGRINEATELFRQAIALNPLRADFYLALTLKIHDFRNTEGLAMVQIRYRGGFETKNEAFT